MQTKTLNPEQLEVLKLFASTKEFGSFEYFAKKFHGASFDPYHRLRSLTYFEEADREPMPVMVAKTSWDEVKKYFTSESKKLWGKALV